MYFQKFGKLNPRLKFRPLLVLHGFLGRGNNFKSVLTNPSILNGRDVYLFDMRNHGKSKQMEEFSLEGIKSDIMYVFFLCFDT